MKIFLYDHSGCYNRGCEAIVRSTVTMLRKYLPDAYFGLCSYNIDTDSALEGFVDELIDGSFAPLGFAQSAINAFNAKLFGNFDYYYKAALSHVVKAARGYDACMLIGGDTFCYGDNIGARLLTKSFLSMGKKTFLWGCSVGKTDLTPEKIETLKSFTAVFTRESLSEAVLREAGVERVYLYPDPAFTLEPDLSRLPETDGRTVGINLSPIVAAANKRLADCAVRLIEYIEKETDHTPLLVPHVVLDRGDGSFKQNDWKVLNEILKHDALKKAVLLPGDMTAAQYKGCISKCDAFIGARTHSLVAAYSSCVPALAIGYSIKARGMARDIFGEENYILNASEIDSADTLINGFKNVFDNREQISDQLGQVIPDIRRRSFAAGEKLCEMLK